MANPMILALLLAATAAGAQLSAAPDSGAPVQTQNAAGAPDAAPPVYKSDLDFSYGYLPDWTVIDTKPMTPAVRLQGQDKATSDGEKQAAACMQLGLLLRRGEPASLIMTIGLPFECIGKSFQQSELPGFGSGVAIGLARSFDISDPVYGAYKLGSHNLWIERANAKSKSDPPTAFTMETVCALLKKGAVCWMGMAHDDDSLKAFETGQVALEGEAPTGLVPPDAFAKPK